MLVPCVWALDVSKTTRGDQESFNNIAKSSKVTTHIAVVLRSPRVLPGIDLAAVGPRPVFAGGNICRRRAPLKLLCKRRSNVLRGNDLIYRWFGTPCAVCAGISSRCIIRVKNVCVFVIVVVIMFAMVIVIMTMIMFYMITSAIMIKFLVYHCHSYCPTRGSPQNRP